MEHSVVREVGVPVRSVNRASLYPGRGADGRSLILGTMSQQAGNFFLLVVDPASGAFRQLTVDVPESNYTTAVYPSVSGRLYIGAAHSGHLFCYDPGTESLQSLGAINPEAAVFPCRIDEDSRGGIWISSYGTADLTRYDPETGELTRFGRMDDADMYAYCYVNTDDTVACLIMQTRPHVVVLDPRTGRKQVVGPVVTRGEGTLTLHRGTDGRLYIESTQGNYRLDGLTAVPVQRTVPADTAPPTLPDGTTFRYADAAESVNRNLELIRADGGTETFYLDYEAAGTDIFCLHGGPDGRVYGSSVLPEHFFRYDPADREMVDFGVCSEATGEAYSMATLNGKIYISSYPGARLSEYDPALPYRYGREPSSNPRELGRIDDISYRPRSTLAGPDGKVWLASLPDYGFWGGPLAFYDPSTGAKTSYRRIVGDASCYTMAWLQDRELIAVGTTVQGGSGTQPRVERAVLFLFDYKRKVKVWEGTLEEPVLTFTALVSAPDEWLLGTARIGGDAAASVLFQFDLISRSFAALRDVPQGVPLENGLQIGPDGRIYGLTTECVYRLDPKGVDVETVVVFDEPLRGHAAAGPIIGGEIYFSSGHRLLSARIDGLQHETPGGGEGAGGVADAGAPGRMRLY